MAGVDNRVAPSPARAALVALLLVGGGLAVLLLFFYTLLKPNHLSALSLPLVAITAGVAAAFNPCAVPALPAFLAFGGCDYPRFGRIWGSASVAIGAMAAMIPIGAIVAAVGSNVTHEAHAVRWIQLGVGLFLVVLALAQLLGRRVPVPFVPIIIGSANWLWERAAEKPSAWSNFTFGVGFVAVGSG